MDTSRAGSSDFQGDVRRTGGSWWLRATVVALVMGLAPTTAAAAVDGESLRLADLVGGITDLLVCDSLLHGLGDQVALCSHGDDDHLHPEVRAAAAGTGTSALPTLSPVCLGDGVGGTRVEVLVVDVPGGLGVADDDVRRWVGQVDWTFDRSAQRTGGRRQLRWVTESTSTSACRVKVRHVQATTSDVETFPALISALSEQGFTDSSRKYLLWVDSPDNFCGIATSTIDDSPTGNAADRTVGYARVDRDCWATGDRGLYSVAAHELAHTFGAVQPGAPNAAGQQHCTDEWDLMCYADGADGVPMTLACQDADPATGEASDPNNALLDCNGDDYFTTAVAAGWLATHWNVADSAFLHDPGSVQDRTSTGPVDEAARPGSVANLGRHAPVVAGGARFDACQLPLNVLVTDGPPTTSSGLLGLGGGTDEPSASELRTMLEEVGRWTQSAVGRPVLTIDPVGIRATDPRVSSAPAQTIVATSAGVRPSVGEQVVPTRLDLDVSSGRIHSAVVTLDDQLTGQQLALWGSQAVAQALGLARAGDDGDLMSPWPTVGASKVLAGSLLRHLYGAAACGEERAIADTTRTHASQRRDGGSRERLHLASTAQQPADVALDVAAWLRGQRGPGWASDVVVCRDDLHADCLAGSGLVGTSGLLLYVPGGPGGSLPTRVAKEVEASLAGVGRVWVLGGTRAVSSQVEQDLGRMVGSTRVRRLAGTSRFGTAAAVASEVRLRGSTGPVILARADDPVDAVAAGALAARKRLPILLTNPSDVPNETSSWLGRDRRRVVVVGGVRAVSNEVMDRVGSLTGAIVRRVSGSDRHRTALALATDAEGWGRAAVVGDASWILVNGESPQTWAVALAVASVASHLDAPLLYVGRAGIPGSVRTAMADLPAEGSPGRILTVTVGGANLLDPIVARAAHTVVVPGRDGNLR